MTVASLRGISGSLAAGDLSCVMRRIEIDREEADRGVWIWDDAGRAKSSETDYPHELIASRRG
jgi:hypothetical protein